MFLVRSGAKAVGVFVVTAGLVWLSLGAGHDLGRVPAVWWSNAALVSILLLDGGRFGTESSSAGSARAKKISPRRNWPLLLAAGYLGNLAGHLAAHSAAADALAFAACDIGETALAAYGFTFTLTERVDLAEQRQLLRFVGWAVLLAPLLASIAAGVELRLRTGTPIQMLLWFPADALGMAIIPPLVLGLARWETWRLFLPPRLARTLLYLLLVAAGTVALFWWGQFGLLFLLIPPLLLLVVRLGLSGGALGCCVVAAAGTEFTLAPRGGPMTALGAHLDTRILMLQSFLAAAVLSVSVVAVVLTEARRASRDVRDRELRYRSLEASMEMLATVDPLTLVANKRRFEDALRTEWQRAMRGGSPLSLVLVEIDAYQHYRVEYGEETGDDCLRRVARELGGLARRPADLVARLCEGQFGILLPETSVEGARAFAEKLRRGIEQLEVREPQSSGSSVTVSAGCATMVPLKDESPAALLHSADAALNEARRKGHNRVEVFEMVLSDALATLRPEFVADSRGVQRAMSAYLPHGPAESPGAPPGVFWRDPG